MAEISVNKELNASADDAWKVLADFGGMQRWAPGIEDARNEGEGVGMVRILTMPGGAVMHERLESFDEAARTLSYSIVEGPMPLENYLATIQVTETAGGCRVDWGASFDAPEGIPADAIGKGVEGAYSGMLEALAKHLG